ncbi:hypothetical protein D3C71_2103410 [compost metagenome]
MAASYKLGSMVVSAARKIIALKPMSFHIPEPTNTATHEKLWYMKAYGSPKNILTALLIMPFSRENKVMIIIDIITQDRKWGI